MSPAVTRSPLAKRCWSKESKKPIPGSLQTRQFPFRFPAYWCPLFGLPRRSRKTARTGQFGHRFDFRRSGADLLPPPPGCTDVAPHARSGALSWIRTWSSAGDAKPNGFGSRRDSVQRVQRRTDMGLPTPWTGTAWQLGYRHVAFPDRVQLIVALWAAVYSSGRLSRQPGQNLATPIPRHLHSPKGQVQDVKRQLLDGILRLFRTSGSRSIPLGNGRYEALHRGDPGRQAIKDFSDPKRVPVIVQGSFPGTRKLVDIAPERSCRVVNVGLGEIRRGEPCRTLRRDRSIFIDIAQVDRLRSGWA